MARSLTTCSPCRGGGGAGASGSGGGAGGTTPISLVSSARSGGPVVTTSVGCPFRSGTRGMVALTSSPRATGSTAVASSAGWPTPGPVTGTGEVGAGPTVETGGGAGDTGAGPGGKTGAAPSGETGAAPSGETGGETANKTGADATGGWPPG